MLIFNRPKPLQDKKNLRMHLAHIIFLFLLTNTFFSQSLATRTANPNRRMWDSKSDSLLLKVIKEFEGNLPWSKIAERYNAKVSKANAHGQNLVERSAKSCRERYFDHLQDGINNSPITKKECELILELVKEYGTRWVIIANILNNGRTAAHIKNTYYGKLKKQTETMSVDCEDFPAGCYSGNEREDLIGEDESTYYSSESDFSGEDSIYNEKSKNQVSKFYRTRGQAKPASLALMSSQDTQEFDHTIFSLSEVEAAHILLMLKEKI